jgi:branched-chain amino acid transport system substrate-binding protein
VALLLFSGDVNALGLNLAQGLTFTESFYWDLNDGTRGFSERFQKRVKSGNKPSMAQAGDYASVLHYLKALEALGGNPHDGAKVVAKMKEMPTDDPLFGKGTIRADGRKIHPAYLFEVKKPAESKYPWDYYKLITTIPAEEAFRPLDQSECPLVKK